MHFWFDRFLRAYLGRSRACSSGCSNPINCRVCVWWGIHYSSYGSEMLPNLDTLRSLATRRSRLPLISSKCRTMVRSGQSLSSSISSLLLSEELSSPLQNYNNFPTLNSYSVVPYLLMPSECMWFFLNIEIMSATQQMNMKSKIHNTRQGQTRFKCYANELRKVSHYFPMNKCSKCSMLRRKGV